ARVAPPLDVRHERGQVGIVVAQDVLDEEGAAGPQDAGDLPEGGQELGEMVGGDAARDGAEGRLLEGKGTDTARQGPDGRRGPAGGELARGPQHGLGEVRRDHALGEPREGERRVAGARGDVEHARRCAPPAALDPPLEIRPPRVTRAPAAAARPKRSWTRLVWASVTSWDPTLAGPGVGRGSPRRAASG